MKCAAYSGPGGSQPSRLATTQAIAASPASRPKDRMACRLPSHLRHLLCNFVRIGLVGDGNQDVHLASREHRQSAGSNWEQVHWASARGVHPACGVL